MSNTDKISNELSFLISACLIADKNFEESKYSDLDFKLVHQLAKWSRVESLLYDYVADFEHVPATLNMGDLRNNSIHGAISYLVFLRKSLLINADFASNGISAFLMKGAMWAWLLYEKPGLREFGDIDFYFRNEDVGNALSILKSHGFQTDGYREFLFKNSKVAKLYFESDYQLPLEPVSPDETVRSLEIQWKPTYPRLCYTLSFDQLMSKSMFLNILESPIRVPSLEYQLLMMIIHHVGVEQLDKLKFMTDLVLILRKFASQMDWNLIEEISKSQGFNRLLLESIGFVKEITGEDYFKYLETPSSDFPSAEFKKSILKHWEEGRENPVTKSWQLFYFNFKYRDNYKVRLKIVANHIKYIFNLKLLIPKLQWYTKNRF